MKSLYIRHSENLLFAVLIMAMVGWSAASVSATEASALTSLTSATCKIAGALGRHDG
jgi:hypothetical protein